MHVTTILLTAGLLLGLLAQTGQAAESGTVIKPVEIKAEPFHDAKALANLVTGDEVQIVKRDGAWLQISSPMTGWVKMLSIRRGTASASGVTLTGITALASGRAGTGTIVSTTGIRGLNEEELKNSTFNEKEVETVESYTVSKNEAVKFAAKRKLKSHQVPYLEQ